MAHVRPRQYRNERTRGHRLISRRVGGRATGPKGALSHIVDEVIDVHYIAGGKYPRNTGGAPLIHDGAAGHGIQTDPSHPRQLVFGDETDGEEQAVTGQLVASAWNWLPALIYLVDIHRLDALMTAYSADRRTQMQGDVKVMDALDEVPPQTTDVRQNLNHGDHLCSLESQASCHDHTDVTGAQDHKALPRHVALDVDQALGRSRRIHARRPHARDSQCAARSLATAHGQDHCPGLDIDQAGRLAHGDHARAGLDGEDHRLAQELDTSFLCLAHPTSGVLWAGQISAKYAYTETIMDALGEDAAQLVIPFYY